MDDDGKINYGPVEAIFPPNLKAAAQRIYKECVPKIGEYSSRMSTRYIAATKNGYSFLSPMGHPEFCLGCGVVGTKL